MIYSSFLIGGTVRSNKPLMIIVAAAGGCLLAGSVLASAFDVTTYGAVCDGTTDDRAAIQTAIDAAEVAGGRVLFPAGTCVVGGAGINVTNATGVYLEGRGRGATVLRRKDGTYSGSSFMVTFSSASDSGLRGLAIDGNRTGASGGSQWNVKLFLSSGIQLEDLDVVESAGDGLFIYGSQGVSVRDARFTAIAGDAIVLSAYWDSVSVVGCHFTSIEGRGIYHSSGGSPSPRSDLVVKRNTFDQSLGAEAIFLSWGGIQGAVIADNAIHNGKIRLYSGGGLRITGNQIDGGGVEIWYGQPEPMIVANNTIENPTGYGIDVKGVSGATSELFQISFLGNRIRSDYGGIKLSFGQNINITANVIEPITAVLPSLGEGVLVAAKQPMTSILIADNLVENMRVGASVGPYSTSSANVDAVLITGNVARSDVAGATGFTVIGGPNGAGGSTTNFAVEDNLVVVPTP